MRTSTGTFVTACALSAALIVAACGGSGDTATRADGELFLQPVGAQGPDPFTDSTDSTDSTATTTTTGRSPSPHSSPSSLTRTRQPARSGVRSISGATPGLYGGTAGSGSCDVNRQIDHLAANPDRGRAFARVAGVSPGSVPAYLRSLTSVVLRADTRVTNHGYRDGRATGFQSVLQTGTAVLVDNRGVPRVRCACGNPLTPARATGGGAVTGGQAWSGYRPGHVVVVTPAPQVITHITIIDIVHHTWIERPCGHDTRHDHVVPPPDLVTPTSTPSLSESPSSTSVAILTPAPSVSPSTSPSAAPDEFTPSPDEDTAERTLPPATAPRTPTVPDEPTVQDPTVEDPTGTTPQDIGPETVPDTPDLPDGGGLIPDGPAEPDEPGEPTTTDSIFDSPTDVFGD
ncbi:DUF6777 domain-containing protein [Streptomyces sp. NPDC046909]|uniref:DUF6777 domain-containing protein n=1 Tax=Streptomyces sp. NPDC046909 TaxID=3155617 RepID=UPI0033CFCD75